MADDLNGGGGTRRRDRAVRVAFAPGTAPRTTPDAEAADDGPAAAVRIDGAGRARVDGTDRTAILTRLGRPRARLVLSEDDAAIESHQVLVTGLPDPGRTALGVRRVEVVVDGWRFELDVDSEARARLRERATSARADAAKGGPSELRAIIPGRVVSVDVAEGDMVEPGGRLLVLEAMKMQNELKAPRAGTVVRVAAGAGQTVELGDLLVVIE